MYWTSPDVLKMSARCTHGIFPMYWTSTDVLNISRLLNTHYTGWPLSARRFTVKTSKNWVKPSLAVSFIANECWSTCSSSNELISFPNTIFSLTSAMWALIVKNSYSHRRELVTVCLFAKLIIQSLQILPRMKTTFPLAVCILREHVRILMHICWPSARGSRGTPPEWLLPSPKTFLPLLNFREKSTKNNRNNDKSNSSLFCKRATYCLLLSPPPPPIFFLQTAKSEISSKY